MSILPGPLQITAIALSALLPMLLFCYARIGAFRGSGRLFRAGCISIIGLFAVACLALPGLRDDGDVLGGALLLATALLLCYVCWGLLAWGFTMTLLTAIARSAQPLTLEQWISAYMQGGDLSGFAHNRLRLLICSGLVTSKDRQVTVTPFGMIAVHLVRLVRFATGLG
jgi:hypothetical protein